MGAETHTWNISILAVEVGGSRVQGHHLMHSEFTVSLGYNLGEGVKKKRNRETERSGERQSVTANKTGRSLIHLSYVEAVGLLCHQVFVQKETKLSRSQNLF